MKLFPTHIRLILNEEERSALETLWDELGGRMDEEVELIHRALREGIKALNREAEAQRQDPDRPPTRSQLEARRSAEKKAGDFSKPITRIPEVENYVAAPISKELRRGLGLYLAKHPDLTEEEVIEHLLSVGLDAEGEKPPTLERAARRARLRILRSLMT